MLDQNLDADCNQDCAPDPALAEGTDEQIYEQFRQVAMTIKRRIDLLCALPFDKIDRLRLETMTRDIGKVS